MIEYIKYRVVHGFMERFRGVISLGAYRQERLLREQAQKTAEIAKVHHTVEEKLAAERKRYADLSDDAYASRAEARETIAFLSRFSRKVAKSRPGAPLDLDQKPRVVRLQRLRE